MATLRGSTLVRSSISSEPRPNKRLKLPGANEWAELRCLAGGHDQRLKLLAPVGVAPAA